MTGRVSGRVGRHHRAPGWETAEEHGETVERFREYMERNGHYRCTCGEKLSDHFVDLNGCATQIRCTGFNLDRDQPVNR